MQKMQKFLKTKFGWLSPKGELYPCDKWGHLDIFLNYPEIKQEYPDIANFIDEGKEELYNIEESSYKLIQQGEHPEWHGYEIAEDNYKDKLFKMLINKGWLRIGMNYTLDIVEFEGISEYIKQNYNKIEKIKKELEICLKKDVELKTKTKLG